MGAQKFLFYLAMFTFVIHGCLYGQVVNNNRLTVSENRQKENYLEGITGDYSATVDNRGDLNLVFPLINLPGKNISYQINLIYQSGIHWAQSASEAGLGFSLNIPSITRTINTFPDDKHHMGLDPNLQKGYFVTDVLNPLDMPDSWILQMPGFSTRLYYNKALASFSAVQDPKNLMVNFDPYSTTPIEHSNPNSAYNRSNHDPVNLNNPGWLKENEHLNTACHYFNTGIEKFVIIDRLTGMKYIFGEPSRYFGEIILPYMTTDPHGNNIIPFEYYYKWYLLYILGPDYVHDAGDPYGEPNDNCLGGWIKFEYSERTLLEFYYPGGTNDSRYMQSVIDPGYALGTVYNPSAGGGPVSDITAYYKEIKYLERIISNSHQLDLHYTDREDDEGQFGYFFAGDPLKINADPDLYRTPKPRKLSRMTFGLKNTGSGSRLQHYAFIHDYSLWGSGMNNSGPVKQGRLTLRKIYNITDQTAAGNNPCSQYQETFTIGNENYRTSSPPLFFEYLGREGTGWNTWDVDDQGNKHYYLNPDMFGSGHFWEPLMKLSWTDYKNDRNGFLWFNTNPAPVPHQWAWSLRSITKSSGARTLFRYESDVVDYDYYFQTYEAGYQMTSSRPGGDGLRVKEIVFENGDLKNVEEISYGKGYVHITGNGGQTGSSNSRGSWYVSYDRLKKERKAILPNPSNPSLFARISIGYTIENYVQPIAGSGGSPDFPRLAVKYKSFYLGVELKQEMVYVCDKRENFYDIKYKETVCDGLGHQKKVKTYIFQPEQILDINYSSYHGANLTAELGPSRFPDPFLLQKVQIYHQKLVREDYYDENPGYLADPSNPPEVILTRSILYDNFSSLNNRPRIIQEKHYDSRNNGKIIRQTNMVFGCEDTDYGSGINNNFYKINDLSTITSEIIYDTLITDQTSLASRQEHLVRKSRYRFRNWAQIAQPQIYLESSGILLDKQSDEFIENQILSRDGFGRILQEKDPEGNLIIYHYGDNDQPFNNSATGLNGYYLTALQKVNGLPDDLTRLVARSGDDLVKEYKYDINSGKICQEKDENGISNYTEYYAGGRLKAVRRFDNRLVKSFEYGYRYFSPNMADYSVEKIFNEDGIVEETIINFMDGCGNLIQKQLVPHNFSEARIITALDYTCFGEIERVYKPYYKIITTPEFGLSFDVSYRNQDCYSESEYWNTAGREIKREKFFTDDGTTSEKKYIYGFAGNGQYYRKITDEAGNATVEYMDLDQNPVRKFHRYLESPLKDLNDARGLTTLQEFDGAGQLVRTEYGLASAEKFSEYINNPVWKSNAGDWYPEYLFLGTDYLKLDPSKTRFQGHWNVRIPDDHCALEDGILEITNPSGTNASRNFWISTFDSLGQFFMKVKIPDYHYFPNIEWSLGEMIPNLFHHKLAIGFSNSLDEPLHISAGASGRYIYIRNFNESALSIGDKIFLRNTNSREYTPADLNIYQLPLSTENEWINLAVQFSPEELKICVEQQEIVFPREYLLPEYNTRFALEYFNSQATRMNMFRIEISDLDVNKYVLLDEVRIIDGIKNTKIYEYDLAGRLISYLNPSSGKKRIKYDYNGNPRFSQDQQQSNNGQISYHTYDFDNRPEIAGVATEDFRALVGHRKDYPFEVEQNNIRTVCCYDAFPNLSEYPWNQFNVTAAAADFTFLKGRLSARCHENYQLELLSYNRQGLIDKKFILTRDVSEVKIYYHYNIQNQLVKKDVWSGSKAFYHFYEYDNFGRLLKVFASENKQKPALCDVKYEYSPENLVRTMNIVQLPDGGFKKEIGYSYNRRNWLTGIDDDASPQSLFAANYEYMTNGNIASAEFNNALITGIKNPRYRYEFQYDFKSRLIQADYLEYDGRWNNPEDYDVRNILYDGSGNIKSLKRFNSSGRLTDNLRYRYDAANRLDHITDPVDYALSSWDIDETNYEYDANGNMTLQWNINERSGLVNFKYNHLNQPVSLNRVGYQTNQLIQYKYNADGFRVYKKIENQPAELFILDGHDVLGVLTGNGRLRYWNIFGNGLVGRCEFVGLDERSENSIPVETEEVFQIQDAVDENEEEILEEKWEVDGELVSTEEYSFDSTGVHEVMVYLTRTDSTSDTLKMTIEAIEPEPTPEPLGEMRKFYYIKDLLGSVRVTLDQNGEGVEAYDYYPFGLKMPDRLYMSGLANTRNLFIGKEHDSETGYDYFGARLYDSRIGRWLNVDKLDQYDSPYVFCANNPQRIQDIDGWYGEDVHFDLTYFMAVMVMGATPEVAAAIAFANNYTDHNPATNPYLPPNWSNQTSRHFESKDSRNIINNLERDPVSLTNEQFGQALHSYQDVNFAHTGFKALGGKGFIGHLLAGKDPDRALDNGKLGKKTVEMIQGLYGIMKKRNCGIANISLEELIEMIEKYVNENGTLEGIQSLVNGPTYNLVYLYKFAKPKGASKNPYADYFHALYPGYMIVVDGVRYY